MKLLEGNGLYRFVLLAGAGLALGLDFACGKQGTLCERRADELIHQHGEQHDVAHDAAVCKGHSGERHAERTPACGRSVMPRCFLMWSLHFVMAQLM